MGKKGSGKAPVPKSTKGAINKTAEAIVQTAKTDLPSQQRILDIYLNSFGNVLSSADFAQVLQHVKQELFNRNFAAAFGEERNLEVYAARWSPTRALSYASVLSGIRSHLLSLIGTDEAITDGSSAVLKALCIGGGAAETVAFAAWLQDNDAIQGDIALLDVAPWAQVIAKLTEALTTPPPLSKYASEAAKAANGPLVAPERFACRFVLQDILNLDKARLAETVGQDKPCLITLLFTLNELFTMSGIGKTSRFLLDLTAIVPMGTLLLVVDSPGSYSETTVGQQAKRYPMQWLLDKVLLGTETDPVEGKTWTKVESDDSTWFRLADGMRYPIALENMRYQMHLYRADPAEA